MSYSAKAKEVRSEARSLFKAMPEVMNTFHSLMKSASKDAVISGRIKELTALTIAIAMRCEGCIVYHVQNVINEGAKREELCEMIAVAIEMGGGPATVYGAKALAAFDELSAQNTEA
jgi:AhpD family alkylhydroperoxidase